MMQHIVLWSYASVWKPRAEAGRDDAALGGPRPVDPDTSPEAAAFVSLMRKVQCGAAPGWWAMTEGIGHG